VVRSECVEYDGGERVPCVTRRSRVRGYAYGARRLIIKLVRDRNCQEVAGKSGHLVTCPEFPEDLAPDGLARRSAGHP